MSSSIKQIYVAVELTENEIKILAGEFFNTRFNIINSYKTNSHGISDFKIVDKDLLKTDIVNALKTVSNKIGSTIEKVILVLPSYNFKRFPIKASVIPSNGFISKSDVSRALTNALSTDIDDDVLLINPVIVKYTINGISSRRMPEKEHCDEMLVDIDLLCADKEVAFDYVSLMEECGVSILDICLNTYAICKEAALIEQSLNQTLILLDINKPYTYLTLLSKGKVVSNEVVFDGLNVMINNIYDNLNIPYSNIARLLKYNVSLEEELSDDAVFAWSKENKSYSVSAKQITKYAKGPLNQYVDKIITMCKPIIDQGPTTIYVTGEGAEMSSLINELKKSSGVDVKPYYPDTIGVRDSSMTALYGSFFIYREKALLKGINVNCIDLKEYDNVIDKRELDVEGVSLTSKIRNLFKQYRQREESK